MKLKIPKLDYALLVFLFFLFIGYLEAGFAGIPAGFFFWAINSVLLPISLIPFGGYFIYKALSAPFLSNIAKFLPVNTLTEKAWIFFETQALLYCGLTSVGVVIAILLLLFYRSRRKKVREYKLFGLWNKVKELVTHLDWKNIKDFMKEFQEKLEELREKVDGKLIGSSIFWLGIGVASHDFWWECDEWIIDTERPTHGAYIGLGLATAGISIIETSPIKNLLHYLGLGSCYLGFNLLAFLPKGPSRWVAHIFWWIGVSLMSWNWYRLVGKEVYESKKVEVGNLKEVINDVCSKYPRKG